MSVPTQIAPELVSVGEASALGYGSPATLWRRIKAGELPVVRIGRRVKIRSEDLRAWGNAADRPADPMQKALEAARQLALIAPPLSEEQIAEVVMALRGGRAA